MVPGTATVVTRYLGTSYLWDTVRVQGGAYGAGLRFSPLDGLALYSSYRDPNLKQTLDTYDAAAAWMEELAVDPAELTKAVVAAIGDLDSPLTPDQKGSVSLRHYLSGTTDALRQRWRDEILAARPEDFKAFAARLAALKASSKAAVFASAGGIDEANAAGAGLAVTKLL